MGAEGAPAKAAAVPSAWCRVQAQGLGIRGLGFRVDGSWDSVADLWFAMYGFWFQV